MAAVAKVVDDGGEGALGYSPKADAPLPVLGVRPPDEADVEAATHEVIRGEDVLTG
jgi:hypothetical protein